MSATRNGEPAPTCRGGSPHGWFQRPDEAVLDCHTCWAIDDERPDPHPPALSWADYVAAKAAPSPSKGQEPRHA